MRRVEHGLVKQSSKMTNWDDDDIERWHILENKITLPQQKSQAQNDCSADA